jgi:HAD superfamily hydrolase (TIGR01490 family)
MTATRKTAAFFDVDETLITAKSMFAFLRHWLALGGDDGTVFRERADALFAIAAQGLPRETGNRAYYRNFAGASAAEVGAAGQDWYAGYRAGPEAYVAASLTALRRHRADGHLVVLVSGSFDACLAPLAADLGADRVLCSEPLVGEDGTYTGETGTSMIGAAKSAAVAKTIADYGLNAADCYGYGDHASDLDMLTPLGHPVVVGTDPALNERAARQGWPVLPQTGGGREGT